MTLYFNIDDFRGISTYVCRLPGYSPSHSCIRLSKNDAFWIYSWADQWVLSSFTKIAAYDTPVMVFGECHFGERKSRFRLAEDSGALQFHPCEITAVVDEHIIRILQRQVQHDSL